MVVLNSSVPIVQESPSIYACIRRLGVYYLPSEVLEWQMAGADLLYFQGSRNALGGR